MTSKCTKFLELWFIQNKDVSVDHVHHRSSCLLCFVPSKPSLLPLVICRFDHCLCLVSSHLLLYWGEFHHFPFFYPALIPAIPIQPLMIHWGCGKRMGDSLQNFRGPKETNLLCDFGNLEFSLEERNNGRKCKRPRIRTSECVLDPVLICMINTEQITETFGALVPSSV